MSRSRGKGPLGKTVFLAVLLASTLARAQVLDSANGSLQILRVPFGARAAGMGDSFSAVADDPSAVYWNPAGLSGIRMTAIEAAYNSWLVDSAIQDLAAALPFTFGTLGLRATYVDYGSFELRDNSGALQGSLSPFNLGLAAAFGHDFGFLSAGLALKFSDEAIGDYYLNGFGADVGFLVPVGRARVAFGARNLDPSDTYRSSQDYYGGLSCPFEFGGNELLIALEGETDDLGEQSFNQGVEFGYRRTVFLRGGARWNFGALTDGPDIQWSGGIGVAVGGLQLDYSIGRYGDLGTVHRVSLGYRFGGFLDKPEEDQKGTAGTAQSFSDEIKELAVPTPSSPAKPAILPPGASPAPARKGKTGRNPPATPTPSAGTALEDRAVIDSNTFDEYYARPTATPEPVPDREPAGSGDVPFRVVPIH